MKYFVILFFTAFSTALVAQNRFGITGGIQLTGLHSEDQFNNFAYPQLGFRVGGLYEHGLTEKFGIRTEFSYSLAGGSNHNTEHLYLGYLSIPLLPYFSPLKKLRFYLGPEVNIFLHDSPTGESYNSNDFKPLDFGITVGSEWRISESLGLSFRNYFGLIHASELKVGGIIQPDDQPIDPYTRTLKFNRNNILQLSINYYFSKESR